MFIISVAIIYAYAANRFAEFPAQAERANFISVLTQLQAGINLELMFGSSGGVLQSPELLVGVNPMELMLSPPSNYLGEYDASRPERLERRSWYFDRDREELVYLVNAEAGVYLQIGGDLVPTNELRFKVEAVRRKFDTATGLDAVVAGRANPVPESNLQERLAGILLQPLTPYTWESAEEAELVAPTLASRRD